MTMVETRLVCGGVDTHSLVHVAAVVDHNGGLFGIEEFEVTHQIGRGGHQPKPSARVGQHQPGSLHVEQFDARVRQHMEEVDDIEVVDQRIRKHHEEFTDPSFPGDHRLTP